MAGLDAPGSVSAVTLQIEGALAVVTLDRPPVNALVPATHQEILDTFQSIAVDEALGAVIVTGAGRIFSAGIDIKEPAGRAGTPVLWRATPQSPRRGRPERRDGPASYDTRCSGW